VARSAGGSDRVGLHAPCVGCVGEAAYHPWTLVQESARTDHLRHTGRHAAAAIRSSVFTGPPAVPGEHSSKPDEVRDWIAAAYPDCGQLELFARTAAPGWERWGNQAPYQASLTWAVRKTGSTMRKWLNASGKQAPGAASQKPSSAVRLQPNHQLSRSPAKVKRALGCCQRCWRSRHSPRWTSSAISPRHQRTRLWSEPCPPSGRN
jgi:hypothetical protein